MNETTTGRAAPVRIGNRRYHTPAWKDRPVSGFFGRPAPSTSDTPAVSGKPAVHAASTKPGGPDPYREAILALSYEDEEMTDAEERGPIMFKDGLFQIDVDHSDGAPPIDPDLKGLIDSILNP